jgi:hypothetical protein
MFQGKPYRFNLFIRARHGRLGLKPACWFGDLPPLAKINNPTL